MIEKIRNFCIIAHIDHGKSTLADRMLEITWTIKNHDKDQVLDTMELEQERWITIKMTPARMYWKWYEFNLIDTPWHADFQYEVSRSLKAVEWVILLVDATQWIQAQTLSTLYMAIDNNLEIIPVLNKIDLPAADVKRVSNEINNLLWIPEDEIISISAKTWLNVEKVLDKIIEKIPSPKKNTWPAEAVSGSDIFSKALIFDSIYDKYKWVVVYVKVLNWSFKKWDIYHLIHTDTDIVPTEVGFLTPNYNKDKELSQWQIWYIVTWKKSVRDAQIWDTIITKLTDTFFKNKNILTIEWQKKFLKNLAVKWFKKATPYVFAWVYPLESSEYDKLKESFEKLILNDSAIEYTNETSKALWFWFRCWFLWLLHMDIVRERLSREFWVETIFTTPTVPYLVKIKNKWSEYIKTWRNVIDLVETWLWSEVFNLLNDNYFLKFKVNWLTGWNLKKYILNNMKKLTSMNEKVEFIKQFINDWMVVKSWANMVGKWDVEKIYEPVAEVEIIWPEQFTWNIMSLVQEYRWSLLHMEQLDQTRTVWKYTMPLWEIIIDFYDRLKSATKWYATMNYEFKKYIESDLVKLDIFINQEIVEAFSLIVHSSKAYYVWRDIVKKLKELIPKHLFAIPIQAWIWTKIIARETIPALKKDVIAKCYWWDISRKKKLLKKQKEWKKKMKALWNVSVPPDVFVKMVTRD